MSFSSKLSSVRIKAISSSPIPIFGDRVEPKRILSVTSKSVTVARFSAKASFAPELVHFKID